MEWTQRGLTFVIMFPLSGCSLFGFTPVSSAPVGPLPTISEIMTDRSYSPVDIFRSDWGVGTVINFEDGIENIVWFDSECLGLAQGDQLGQTAEVTLNSRSMNFNSKKEIEGSIADNLIRDVNLSGAYSDERVARIEVSFLRPSETVVSDGSLTLRIENMVEQSQPCVDNVVSGNAFVIDRTISADGFSSTFSDDRNTILDIDANLLAALDARTSIRNKFAGSNRISSEETRILGYRLFKYIAVAGQDGTNIQRKRLSPEEVAKLKEDSVRGVDASYR